MKLIQYFSIQETFNDHAQAYARDSLTSLREARLQLDREINELEHALVQLKMRRNALARAVTLPAEILSKIFLHTRDACIEQDPRSKKWVAVAETCRRGVL